MTHDWKTWEVGMEFYIPYEKEVREEKGITCPICNGQGKLVEPFTKELYSCPGVVIKHSVRYHCVDGKIYPLTTSYQFKKYELKNFTEQEEIINHLREKLEGEKEVLKGELEVDYNQMEEIKDRYIQYYRLAPFHLTEAELSDLNEFRDYHESSREEPDEEGYRFCRRAIGFRMPITFHYIPSMYSHKVIAECPYCHTQRELGSGTDVLEERENCVND